MDQRYFTVKEVAKYLRVGEGTIRSWMRFNKIPFSKVNGSIRFDKEIIDEWMRDALSGQDP